MSVVSKPSSRPDPPGREPPSGPPGDPRVPLRLSVTRGRLGLELYEPMQLGPIKAEQVALSFVGLKFPLDLSGGVPAFRHRRGNLERVVLSTDIEQLRKWIEPRLRSAFGPLVRPVDLWWHSWGLSIGFARETSAIAWDLHWAPLLGSARWVVGNARGWGLSSPALAEALRVMDALTDKVFSRRGRVLWLEDAGRRLSRSLLPAVGARAPAATEVAFGAIVLSDLVATVALDATHGLVELGQETTRAIELSELTRSGDDALALGELELARNAYLAALESAPRQRELVLLVAEIDLQLGRFESALGLVSEAMPILVAGTIGAQLLKRSGEPEAALEILGQAARDERYSPLAAMILLSCAEIASGGLEQRFALDAAVAASPTLMRARWARLEARASFGDLPGAIADAQHLEASSSGRKARHEVCRRAADLLLRNGFEVEAGQLFQRALRYGPEDIASMVGLARALNQSGQAMRAIPLLERAVQGAEQGAKATGDALVELSRLIATKLQDLPQAVARLRRVPPSDPAAAVARALEARYRFMLGDAIGASLAFARMREIVEMGPSESKASEMLIEAARFERDVMRDPSTAERHLALALRLSPHQPMVQELYREVAAVLTARKMRNRSVGDEIRKSDVTSDNPVDPTK